MATIYPDSYQVPATPTKGNVFVRSSEVAPDYSPGAAPRYVANAKDNTSTTESSNNVEPTIYKAPEFNIMPIRDPSKLHPSLPIGDVFYDIRNHLGCHQLFNTNVETLMSQFRQMREDLDASRESQARAERELAKEREEKESYKRETVTLQAALREAQDDLTTVRGDLIASEERLRLAISQLTEAARKLEQARNDLRLRTRERDDYARQLADVTRERDFYTARAAELQAALVTANEGENAANDRNTRLTAMLFQIEASKAAIERVKDAAEVRVRELRAELEDIRKQPRGDAELREIVIKLRMEIHGLEIKVRQLEDERNDAQRQLTDRNGRIDGLERQIESLNTDLDTVRTFRDIYQDLAAHYENIAKGLHKKCRRKFPIMRVASGENGLAGKLELIENPDDGNDESDSEAEPTEATTVAGPSEGRVIPEAPPAEEPTTSAGGATEPANAATNGETAPTQNSGYQVVE